ncbi:uncharacterized protein LOC117130407 [Brassica rapa]|uniref:uncharacterized protein LOC117130407 n=1 Tax=Brassica campestris TaxID=3711 RepID=UPI00142E7E53|nr:uncharacterized protein LOC117130407 [Brassica rapa]
MPLPVENDHEITFSALDTKGVHMPHNDPLLIDLDIGECLVTKVLIDTGSSVDLIFRDTLDKMGVDLRDMKPSSRTLSGFNGASDQMIGTIRFPLFLSTYHQCVKFPGKDGKTQTIRGDQQAARELLIATVKMQQQNSLVNSVERFDVLLEDLRHEGNRPRITSHELHVDPTFKPIRQKQRKLGPERSKAVNEEVNRLLDAGFITEVRYPKWLANPVVVKKKNVKWRICVDFTDLNKACPKDSYPLPHIERLVESTATLPFMDAFSGTTRS